MNLYLVRHTQPLINSGVCYGHSDIPLPKDCGTDFHRVARAVKALVPENATVFSSPLQRCHQLARFLFPDHGILVDPRLREMNFGSWEMQPWDAVPRAELDAWALDVTGYTPPEGENWLAVLQRCRAFAEEYLVDPQASYCLVTHAGIIRTFLALLLQSSAEKTSKKMSRTLGALSGDPAKGLPALLAEPIAYGAICHIEVCSTTHEVRYTISARRDNG